MKKLIVAIGICMTAVSAFAIEPKPLTITKIYPKMTLEEAKDQFPDYAKLSICKELVSDKNHDADGLLYHFTFIDMQMNCYPLFTDQLISCSAKGYLVQDIWRFVPPEKAVVRQFTC